MFLFFQSYDTLFNSQAQSFIVACCCDTKLEVGRSDVLKILWPCI